MFDGLNSVKLHVFASGWKTARVVVLLFDYRGWVGRGGIITFMWPAYGWGGIITFVSLAYTRDATLLLHQ